VNRLQAAALVNDAMTLQDALALHYRNHGLPADGGASDSWFVVRVGPIGIPLPNPPARQRAVFLHDINHIITGYNTKLTDGELAIAAFEVGAGCGPFWIAWYLNLALFGLGLLMRPRLVLRAFLRGRRTASLYHDPPSHSALSTLTVSEIRRRVKLDDLAGLEPRSGDYAAFVPWAAAAMLTFLAPSVFVAGALWWVWRAFL
jgi:hypothetical protein